MLLSRDGPSSAPARAARANVRWRATGFARVRVGRSQRRRMHRSMAATLADLSDAFGASVTAAVVAQWPSTRAEM